MKTSHSRILALCLLLVVVGLIGLWSAVYPVHARVDEARSAAAHYTVVMTEGHNLLVTDNAGNKLYFYTIDKDKPIGSPLKLRASIDLGNVGQDEIQITKHNLEGMGGK
jgi:hypothetical protein